MLADDPAGDDAGLDADAGARRRLSAAAPRFAPRRERVEATMARIAVAFERIIEDAPDQWWAAFFPIWPDLEAGTVS